MNKYWIVVVMSGIVAGAAAWGVSGALRSKEREARDTRLASLLEDLRRDVGGLAKRSAALEERMALLEARREEQEPASPPAGSVSAVLPAVSKADGGFETGEEDSAGEGEPGKAALLDEAFE